MAQSKKSVRRADTLAELMGQCDFVSIHAPLTSETRGLIGADAFAAAKRGMILINTARGNIVDVLAIPAAIASGQLAGVGLDVLPQEPPPADHPLIVAWRDPKHSAYNRLILNAHNAFYSVEGLRDMRVKGAEACRRALTGQPLRNVVN